MNNLVIDDVALFVRDPRIRGALMFFGESGGSKARLLEAIKRDALYITAKDFLNEFVESLRHNQKERFNQKYRNNSILIVDDVQFLAGRELTQEELIKILKDVQHKGSKMIFLLDRHPALVEDFSDELVEHLTGGLMFNLNNGWLIN